MTAQNKENPLLLFSSLLQFLFLIEDFIKIQDWYKNEWKKKKGFFSSFLNWIKHFASQATPSLSTCAMPFKSTLLFARSHKGTDLSTHESSCYTFVLLSIALTMNRSGPVKSYWNAKGSVNAFLPYSFYKLLWCLKIDLRFTLFAGSSHWKEEAQGVKFGSAIIKWGPHCIEVAKVVLCESSTCGLFLWRTNGMTGVWKLPWNWGADWWKK